VIATPLAEKIAENLAQHVAVAGFLKIGCDHFLGIGRWRRRP